MIAVVGGDGAGKSSAIRMLRSALQTHYRVKLVDKWDVLDKRMYPHYRFVSNDLPLLRRCISEMPEVTRTLFLFWLLLGTLTPAALADAEIVLLDGYWPKHGASEIIYSGRLDLVGTLIGLMPSPAVTLWLDVDPATAYRRRIADAATPLVPYECGLDPHCSEAAFLRHQQATRELMRDWSLRFGWRRIDGNAGRALVNESLLRAVGHALRDEPPRGDS